MRVCKFGGYALRDAAGFARVRAIMGPGCVAVASAPGRRDRHEEKVTDLLYACQSAAAAGREFGHLFDRVAERYRGIARGIGLPLPDGELRQIYRGLKTGASPAWAASRGEWLCAHLLSDYLGLPFVEAAETIRFDRQGRLLPEETAERLRRSLTGGAVLPGFYGADERGEIHTFPRGGSDVTAALAAAAINADVCETWKDVRGEYAADPAPVADARIVPRMSYRALRTLSALGAQVLCEAAVAPLRAAGIPLNVRGVEEPAHPGTVIGPAFGGEGGAVIGVTGKAGLTLLRLERLGREEALAREVMEAGAEIERLAFDADGVCLLLRGGEGRLSGLGDCAARETGVCALSVVGEGLERIGAAARLDTALAGAGRPLAMHQPPRGLYLTALLRGGEYAAGVRAAYDAFLRE